MSSEEKIKLFFENFDKQWELDAQSRLDKEFEEYDPTPWCHICGAMEKAGCNCGPYAENH